MRNRIASAAILMAAAGCAAPLTSGVPSGSAATAGASAPASIIATPSAQGSASPAESPEATPDSGIGYEPSGNWTIAESTVDGLRVRVAPGLASAPVLLPVADAHYEYQLAAGERVLRYALVGRKDGYAWWEIFATPPGFSDLTIHGYVAGSGSRNSPWLVDVHEEACPVEPTFKEIAALVPFMRAACYDRFPLTFDAYAWTIPGEGYGGACGVGMGDGVRVDWLQCENINHNWVNASGNTDATFLLHYNPEVLAAPDVIEIQGQPLKITGHFIDPASEECADPASSESEQTVAYWDCAMKFVVDRLE